MIKINDKYKKISLDFIYNILASLLLTGAMQIIVYPLLARLKSDEEYGAILTIMGIVNTISISLGSSLNNLRLIENSKYEQKNIEGDFNIILLLSVANALFITFFLTKFLYLQNFSIVIGLCVLTIFSVLKCYFCVQFRLALNFKKILIQNALGAIGFGIGSLIIWKIFFYWPLPFIIAEFFQIGYIISNTSLYTERYFRTVLFKPTFLKYIILIITGLSTTLITYLDRIILYPLLGGQAVSAYTVASFFGKTLGIVMTPVAGVLLGYYAQKEFKMSNAMFWKVNVLTFLGGLCFIIISCVFSPFFTKLLYPTIYNQAKNFIFMANLAATISVLCQLTQSAVLKFAPTWIQIVKELVYAFAYILLGFLLLKQFGLYGFCIAAIVANLVKLITLYILGNKYIGKKE